jgi:hypothetical protein
MRVKQNVISAQMERKLKPEDKNEFIQLKLQMMNMKLPTMIMPMTFHYIQITWRESKMLIITLNLRYNLTY